MLSNDAFLDPRIFEVDISANADAVTTESTVATIIIPTTDKYRRYKIERRRASEEQHRQSDVRAEMNSIVCKSNMEKLRSQIDVKSSKDERDATRSQVREFCIEEISSSSSSSLVCDIEDDAIDTLIEQGGDTFLDSFLKRVEDDAKIFSDDAVKGARFYEDLHTSFSRTLLDTTEKLLDNGNRDVFANEQFYRDMHRNVRRIHRWIKQTEKLDHNSRRGRALERAKRIVCTRYRHVDVNDDWRLATALHNIMSTVPRFRKRSASGGRARNNEHEKCMRNK